MQSWDEIARVQQLIARRSQTEHNIDPAATAPATPTPTALKATALTLGLRNKSPWQQDGGHLGTYNLVLHPCRPRTTTQPPLNFELTFKTTKYGSLQLTVHQCCCRAQLHFLFTSNLRLHLLIIATRYHNSHRHSN